MDIEKCCFEKLENYCEELRKGNYHKGKYTPTNSLPTLQESEIRREIAPQ